MGMKSALFFITFFFTSFFCIAQSDNIEFDSLVNYQVKKKETLYSISKKFNVQIDDILLFNSELKIFSTSFFRVKKIFGWKISILCLIATGDKSSKITEK